MPGCDSCGAVFSWATMRGTGKPMPVDVAEISPHDVQAGAVAVRRRDRLGVVLDTAAAMKVRADAGSWSEWSFHTSHFDTCPDAGEHRREVHPAQETLL